MDLHPIPVPPSDAERRAVDGVVGPPRSGWEGGTWNPRRDGHLARGDGQRRHLLLPALWALQDAVGGITEGGLGYVCTRLHVPPAEAFGVATFYVLLAVGSTPRRRVHVCDDIVCRRRGGIGLLEAARDAAGPDTDVIPSPCLGRCEQAPALFVQEVGGGNRALFANGRRPRIDDLELPPQDPHPASVYPTDPGSRITTRRVGVVDPTDLDDYRAHGGYTALRLALAAGPQAVIEELRLAGLRGRGGAAFPAHIKWAAVAGNPVNPHYVVCNADESEPGTFKDRVLLEHDPFAVIEGLTIAGTTVGAHRGYVYIRGEYPEAERRVRHAIDRARARGFLGDDVMGSGRRFDIEVRRGGGAYICGEETALFNSIEGRRGEPRQKPPFPSDAGLFGRPTLVNNVETLVNVIDVVERGGETFAGIGTPESTGTKLFAVAGDVARPGVHEVPFGTSLRELLDAAGAGQRPGAVLLGGAAGSFVAPDHWDVPLSFEGVREVGATLGSGALTVFDSSADLADVVRRIAAFFRDESCGQCVPCRVGTARQEEALARIVARGGVGDDAPILEDLGAVMRDASICGLGHTAAAAVQSAIRLGLLEEAP